MAEITWMENERFGKAGVPKENVEVRVRCTSKGTKAGERTKFTFFNNADQKISHSDYMVCGISTNRIYFKEEYLRKGYKVQKVRGGHPFILVKAVLTQFEGDYRLYLDAQRNLWYIEKEEG